MIRASRMTGRPGRGWMVWMALVMGLAGFVMAFGRVWAQGTPGGRGAAEAKTPTTTTSAPATTEADEGQHEVTVGVYVNQIKSIDLKANEFIVDFWVWFRWKGESLKPLESFEVVGGHVDSKENEQHAVFKADGEEYQYAACRATATITKFFDISRFPLDEHTLTINIEDGDEEEAHLIYKADTKNTGISDEVQVPGWEIRGKHSGVKGHPYSTNYGNLTLGNKSVYSRFSFEIELGRPGAGYFFKLFWSLFLATIIALLALLIDPIDLDPRFGLGVGAIFAAIASAYVISSALPETNQYTLADKMNMLAIGVIFASILESVFSLRLWKNGKEAASKSLDRLCFWGMLVLYILAGGLLVKL